MLDIGATEILVIAVVAIIVVGPKDLPMLLRKVGQLFSYAKKMSSDFRSHINDTVDETIKDTGLDDIKSTVDDVVGYEWSGDDEKDAAATNDKIMKETGVKPARKTSKTTPKRKKKTSAKGASS